MGRHQNKKVWAYFDRISGVTARCKRCDVYMSYKHATGNLVRHLLTRHEIDASINGSENYVFLKHKKCRKTEYNIPECTGESDYNKQQLSADTIHFNSMDELIKTEKAECSNNFLTHDMHEHFNLTNEEHESVSVPGPSLESEQNPVADIGTAAYNSTSNDAFLKACQAEKLQAETRYYIEMAELARAKRELIQLQSRKLKLELEQKTNDILA